MRSRYSVGKSDVWISGTLALALVKGKDPKAIKLFFFTKQADVFWSKTLFKPISVCF